MLTADIQFARATTNRIWAELMGFGIVEPVDDFDLTATTRISRCRKAGQFSLRIPICSTRSRRISRRATSASSTWCAQS